MGFGVYPEIDEDYLASTGIKRFKPKTKNPTFAFEAIKEVWKRVDTKDNFISQQSVKVYSVNRFEPTEADQENPDGVPNANDGRRYELVKINPDNVPRVKINPLNEVWDSQENNVTDAGGYYVINKTKPIDPNKEVYIYLANFWGTMSFCVFDERGYVSTDPEMTAFTENHKIPAGVPVE